MNQFSILLKKEISRIAKKEIRAEVLPAKKALSQARAEISALKKRLVRMEAALKRLGSSGVSGGAVLRAASSDTESTKLRFRSGGFATLRKKLKLSAHEMAALLGVSAQSVYHWEAGKSKPQARQLEAIASVRKLGKKQVTARLASVPAVES